MKSLDVKTTPVCQIKLVNVGYSAKFIVSMWGFMHNNRPTHHINGEYTTYGHYNDDHMHNDDDEDKYKDKEYRPKWSIILIESYLNFF